MGRGEEVEGAAIVSRHGPHFKLLFQPRDLTELVRLVPAGERRAAERSTPTDEGFELWKTFVQAGNVWLPAVELAPWVAGLTKEAANFPRSTHDDQVDAMTQALNRLLLNPLLLDDSILEESDDADGLISLY